MSLAVHRQAPLTAMLLIFLLIAVAVSAESSSSGSVTLLPEQFSAHVTKYGLTFKSEAERVRALRTFSSGVAKINAHNAAAGTSGYIAGINEFTHLEPEEFRRIYASGLLNKADVVAAAAAAAATAAAGKATAGEGAGAAAEEDIRRLEEFDQVAAEVKLVSTPPLSVDWRKTAGVVTPAKHQLQCGSCWTFSTTGAIEGAYGINSQSFTPPLTAYTAAFQSLPNKAFGFSEQYLTDCDTMLSDGCNGGYQKGGFAYVAWKGGIPSEAKYPYTGKQNATCSGGNPPAPEPGTGLRKDLPFTKVPTNNMEQLELAIARQPVSISVDAGKWQYYQSGIFGITDGCMYDLDHAVLAVGYHTNSNDPSKSYWIVKNSWGDDWGVDGGYIHIAKTDANDCGVMIEPSYPNMEAEGTLTKKSTPSNAPTYMTSGFLGGPTSPGKTSAYVLTDIMDAVSNTINVPKEKGLINANQVQVVGATVTIISEEDFGNAEPVVFDFQAGQPPSFFNRPDGSEDFVVAVQAVDKNGVTNTYVAEIEIEVRTPDANSDNGSRDVYFWNAYGTTKLPGWDLPMSTEIGKFLDNSIDRTKKITFPTSTTATAPGMSVKDVAFTVVAAATVPTPFPTMATPTVSAFPTVQYGDTAPEGSGTNSNNSKPDSVVSDGVVLALILACVVLFLLIVFFYMQMRSKKPKWGMADMDDAKLRQTSATVA